jgi:hypothetical protein
MGFESGAGETIDSGKTPDGRRGVAMIGNVLAVPPATVLRLAEV